METTKRKTWTRNRRDSNDEIINVFSSSSTTNDASSQQSTTQEEEAEAADQKRKFEVEEKMIQTKKRFMLIAISCFALMLIIIYRGSWINPNKPFIKLPIDQQIIIENQQIEEADDDFFVVVTPQTLQVDSENPISITIFNHYRKLLAQQQDDPENEQQQQSIEKNDQKEIEIQLFSSVQHTNTNTDTSTTTSTSSPSSSNKLLFSQKVKFDSQYSQQQQQQIQRKLISFRIPSSKLNNNNNDIDGSSYILNVNAFGTSRNTTVNFNKPPHSSSSTPSTPIVVFVETDKPIYKPGQSILMRLLTLTSPSSSSSSNSLVPIGPEEVWISIFDAKGIKIAKQRVETDDFGFATSRLPLATELNFGTWKIEAEVIYDNDDPNYFMFSHPGGASTHSIDVQVEKYVLPKYKVELKPERSWVLPSDTLRVTASATYSFGQPVRGRGTLARLVALRRLAADWEPFATLDAELTAPDGKHTFVVPPVGYAVGSVMDQGSAALKLELHIEEANTGYKESALETVLVASSPVKIKLLCDNLVIKAHIPFDCTVVAETPAGEPLKDIQIATDVEFEVATPKKIQKNQDQQPDEQPIGFFRRIARPKQPSPHHFSSSHSFQFESRETVKLPNPIHVQTDAHGRARLTILDPPTNVIWAKLVVHSKLATSALTQFFLSIQSPSSTFLHVQQDRNEQESEPFSIGDLAKFKVLATKQPGASPILFYEVVNAKKNQVVHSGVSSSASTSSSLGVEFTITPQMMPESKLLVYQILGNGEVSADALKFQVNPTFDLTVVPSFDPISKTYEPGTSVQLMINASSVATSSSSSSKISKIGISAVDESVFILTENKLNVRKVFEKLDQLYLEPQFEFEQVLSHTPPSKVLGSKHFFDSSKLKIITNKKADILEDQNLIVRGEQLEKADGGGVAGFFGGMPLHLKARPAMMNMMMMEDASVSSSGVPPFAPPSGLKEVSRIRSFFPETWFYDFVTTDEFGLTGYHTTVPDSITTWAVRAVAMSKEHGMGIGETKLVTFRPFFVSLDLPYSSIQSEVFPVSVSLYNYLKTEQTFYIELAPSSGEYEFLESTTSSTKSCVVGPNSVGGVKFLVKPKKLGFIKFKVVARSKDEADAIEKEMLVEPEGIAREIVRNQVVQGGKHHEQLPLVFSVHEDIFSTTTTTTTTSPLILPPKRKTGSKIVPGSERALVSVTSNPMGQVMEGLDNLLQMPCGCGEQNMIGCAPDVSVLRYLTETKQLKPDIAAKAIEFLTIGYQRELTYMHDDGSFSAFGSSDASGNLWLTAFVLKTFSMARSHVYIDETVLQRAVDWLIAHQNADGSFLNVGNLIHRDMSGGNQNSNNEALGLASFVAIALIHLGVEEVLTSASIAARNSLRKAVKLGVSLAFPPRSGSPGYSQSRSIPLNPLALA